MKSTRFRNKKKKKNVWRPKEERRVNKRKSSQIKTMSSYRSSFQFTHLFIYLQTKKKKVNGCSWARSMAILFHSSKHQRSTNNEELLIYHLDKKTWMSEGMKTILFFFDMKHQFGPQHEMFDSTPARLRHYSESTDSCWLFSTFSVGLVAQWRFDLSTKLSRD